LLSCHGLNICRSSFTSFALEGSSGRRR
jgi:hypothetical protein